MQSVLQAIALRTSEPGVLEQGDLILLEGNYLCGYVLSTFVKLIFLYRLSEQILEAWGVFDVDLATDFVGGNRLVLEPEYDV